MRSLANMQTWKSRSFDLPRHSNCICLWLERCLHELLRAPHWKFLLCDGIHWRCHSMEVATTVLALSGPGDYRYSNTMPAIRTLPGCRTCSILEQRAPLPRLACPQVASGFCAVPQGIRRWFIWGNCCSNYNRSCGATNGGRPLTVIVLWVSWNLTSQQFYFLETILLLA